MNGMNDVQKLQQYARETIYIKKRDLVALRLNYETACASAQATISAYEKVLEMLEDEQNG